MLAAMLRGGATGAALSPLPLLRALLQTILAPLLVGISIRAIVPGEQASKTASNFRVNLKHCSIRHHAGHGEH